MRIDWIKRTSIVGAGTMDHSIAMVFAHGGYEVDWVDIKEEALHKGLGLIDSNLQALKEAKLINSSAISRILSP